MDELLAASLSYPTLVYTVLHGVVTGYWLLVMVGAVAFDAFDLDAEADVEAEVDADVDAASSLGLLAGLSLRKVPVTIAVTLVVFVSWLICNVTTHYLGTALSALLPVWLWGSLVLVLATLLGTFVASVLAVPLAPLFDTHEAARHVDLVGSVIEVRSGRVDRDFGQGMAEDGGAGLLVQIRCDPEKVKKGDKVLVIAHDAEQEFYEVEPLSEIMASDKR